MENNNNVEIRIPRVRPASKIYNSGIKSYIESYKSALDEFLNKIAIIDIPIYAELITDKYDSFKGKGLLGFTIINVSNSLGRIIDVDDDSILIRTGPHHRMYTIAKENKWLDNIVAGMRYIGDSDNVYQVDKIITFDVFIRQNGGKKDE